MKAASKGSRSLGPARQLVEQCTGFEEFAPDLFERGAGVRLGWARPGAARRKAGAWRRVRSRAGIHRKEARPARRIACRRALSAGDAQELLHAADRIAVLVQALADAAQQNDVFRPVVASAATALQRLQLGELRFPEAQDMRRQIEVVGDLADGAERRGAF